MHINNINSNNNNSDISIVVKGLSTISNNRWAAIIVMQERHYLSHLRVARGLDRCMKMALSFHQVYRTQWRPPRSPCPESNPFKTSRRCRTSRRTSRTRCSKRPSRPVITSTQVAVSTGALQLVLAVSSRSSKATID